MSKNTGKKKTGKPSYRSNRQGVAFQKHEFARLRASADKAAHKLMTRDPEGGKQLAEKFEDLSSAVSELFSSPEWANVRLDPRVIANYIKANPVPKDKDDKKMGEYVGDCLEKIIDDQARFGLITICLSAMPTLVERVADRMAWANLLMLNMIGDQEVKPRAIPILHNLFWANFADFAFQQNVMAFVGRTLEPDRLISEEYLAALTGDWEEDGTDIAKLATELGLEEDKVAEKVADISRLPILVDDFLDGLVLSEDLLHKTADRLSTEAVELVRTGMENQATTEELDAAAARLIRQMTTAHAMELQGAELLTAIEAKLDSIIGSELGTLPKELAERAKKLLTLLSVRQNPFFDALLLAGVRAQAERDYKESEIARQRAQEQAEASESTGEPADEATDNATDDAAAPDSPATENEQDEDSDDGENDKGE